MLTALNVHDLTDLQHLIEPAAYITAALILLSAVLKTAHYKDGPLSAMFMPAIIRLAFSGAFFAMPGLVEHVAQQYLPSAPALLAAAQSF
jgi:hypothetical protein